MQFDINACRRRATHERRKTQLQNLSELLDQRERIEERIAASATKLEMALHTTSNEVVAGLVIRAVGATEGLRDGRDDAAVAAAAAV